MRFDWDWLSTAMTVPYVPTLGPVHPRSLTPQLFADVVAMAGSRGAFLPYDKDKRWSATKQEELLLLDLVHRPDVVLIPTITHQGNGLVKVHVYGDRSEGIGQAAELAAKLATTHGAVSARMVSFLPPETTATGGTCTRIQLREFTADHPTVPVPEISSLDTHTPAVQATFTLFADKMAGEGFKFLHGQMKSRAVGPVLVAVEHGQVCGAIGPMETLLDNRGSLRLLPQYFAVLPERRGQGHGRRLWRAAMRWGALNGATYQLLQTEVGGASDVLCQAEGLRNLGFVRIEAI
ncbi:GNAT family N-acetyltransferase [Kitasatospora sp. NPDC004289]